MKMTTRQPHQVLLTAIVSLVPICFGFASDTNAPASDISAQQAPGPAPVVSAAPAQAPAPVKLPYGVEDVLKLSHAQIGDEIILNYVQNSGTIYNLGPKDIVYLRDQGVSEKVISAMLNQRTRVEMAAQNVAPQAVGVPNAPMVSEAPAVPQDANNAAQPYTDASATYATAPLTPPASTAYVIPYPAASYAYYGYPYYYGPSVSFAFGYGGYYGGRCYYGGHGYYGGRCYYGGHGGFHGGHH